MPQTCIRAGDLNLSAYFPRIIAEWQQETPGARSRVIEGSLVFMDISGFTAMSERLAKKGRIGAEEVTEVMDTSFASLLSSAYEEGGSLLKFGGDAMLLFFSGPEHARRACRAAIGMRDRLRKEGRFTTSAGMVRLQMSVGVDSGDVHMFLVGTSHLELIVTGPAVTRTVAMEGAANAGQIRISEATAAALPKSCVGESSDGGWLLAKAPPALGAGFAAPPQQEVADPERFVSSAIREHLLATSSQESEHRRGVVCFIHFEGVDELLATSGPAGVEQALSSLVEAIQQAVADFDLCFLSTDIDSGGGKIILTGGVPKSSGNDEEGMLRAVAQIISSKQELELRIGVNAGPVFAGDIGPAYRRTYTVMGDAVNLAARLMAKAAPGQAITRQELVDRARTAFETNALEPFAVKGKSKLISAVVVGAPRERAASPEDWRLPLVGREQEMHLLLATVEEAKEGRRATVNLVGDAGMGKSRIVEELKARAPDVDCHITSCEQYESSTAYFPLRPLLRSLMGLASGSDPGALPAQLRDWVSAAAPDLIEWLPLIAIPLDVTVASTPAVDRLAPRFRRAQLHRVFADLLGRAATRPTIFVIEDAHWMDDASRELLADVFASAAERPWLFLATRRPGDGPLFSDLDDASITIVLDPLSRAASEELTTAAMGDTAVAQHELAALADRAGGNPLFLREMALVLNARTDIEALPDSVEALLTAQIDRLGGPERRVLRYASVVGPTFNVRLLEESLGNMLQGSAADACARLADFVVEEGRDSFRFRHALIRETAYNGLPFRLRLQLHERLGTSIERRHGRRADTRAELLSLHFHRARSYEKSLRYSRIAGERAREKSANVEAAAFFRRAIEAARQLPDVADADQAELYESLGDVCELAAVYDEAARALAQARRHSAGDAAQTRLLRKEGVLRERLGQYTQALRWYGRGLRDDGRRAEASEVNQLQLAYAGVRFRQGRYADCVRWCRTVIPRAEAAGDRTSLAHAYYLLDHSYTMLGSPDAGKYRERALPIFEELGDLIGQANVLNNLGVSATIEGDWDEAMRLFERSRDARERVGDVVGAATATNNIGEVLLDRGNVREAEPLFREALRIWRGANYAVGIAVATSALGLAATRDGRLDEAKELLESALDSFRGMGAEGFVIETEGRLAELYLVAGDVVRARTTIDATLASSQASDMGAVTAALYRLKGFALMRQQRWHDAQVALFKSLALAQTISAQYEIALTLNACAQLARENGEDASRYLDESVALFEHLGVMSVPLSDEQLPLGRFTLRR